MVFIAYNHFIEVGGDTEVNANLGKGAQRFTNLLKGASDVPMAPIKSHHIYSTDNTTEFIYDEVMDSVKKKEAWKRVAFKACEHAEKGVRAVY